MPHKDPERRREYARRYYRSRPEYQKVVRARAHAWTKAHRIRLLEAIVQYLREHPCSDCGEDDPVVLCFDHVVGDKEFHIADAARTGYSLKRMMGLDNVPELREVTVYVAHECKK